jgi:hypothetical protein
LEYILTGLSPTPPGLSPEQTAAFDRAHQELLERIAPAQFNIRHRIRIQIFEPKQQMNQDTAL